MTVTFPNAQTQGDLNSSSPSGANDANAAVQSVAGQRGDPYLLAIGPTTGTRPAAVDLLREEHHRRHQHRDGDVQPARRHADVRILRMQRCERRQTSPPARAEPARRPTVGPRQATGPNELIVGAMMVSSYRGRGERALQDASTPTSTATSPRTWWRQQSARTRGGDVEAAANWVIRDGRVQAGFGNRAVDNDCRADVRSIAGGTAITITGDNFAPGATVTVGGTAATDVSVVNANAITATTPAHIAGVVDLTVTNGGLAENGTLASAFTYLGPAPTVADLTPCPPERAERPLRSRGTGLRRRRDGQHLGISATRVTIVDSTTITATTPAHAFGIINVVVTNLDGRAATLANAFTYVCTSANRDGHQPHIRLV